jgi:hypothetical protein
MIETNETFAESYCKYNNIPIEHANQIQNIYDALELDEWRILGYDEKIKLMKLVATFGIAVSSNSDLQHSCIIAERNLLFIQHLLKNFVEYLVHQLTLSKQ